MTRRGIPTRWGDRRARDRDIREAALALLAGDGYPGLSMRAVAEGAGVSIGTLYTYYPSKQELYASLYERELERLGDAIVAACASASSAGEALVAVVGCYARTYRLFGHDVDVFAVAAERSDAGVAALHRLADLARRVLDSAWTSFVRLEPALRRMSPKQREHAIQLVSITVRGLVEHSASARSQIIPTDFDALTAFAARVLLDGLRALVTD